MDLSGLLDSPVLVASVLTLLAAVTLTIELFREDRSRVDDRLHQERKRRARDAIEQSRIFRDLSATQNPNAVDGTPPLQDRWRLFLEQSGVAVSTSHLLKLSASFGVAGSAIAYLTGGHWFCAVIGGVFALSAPAIYVHARRRRRIVQLRSQLPEAFDLMRRALQAGQTVTNAIQLVSRQCTAPLADEFTCCCEQQNFGLPLETALRDLARRTGVMELQMFAVALVLQRQAGGNPVELLDNLSDLARKRSKLAMRVRAITSEGRMQAIVLSILPIVSFVAIYLIDPSYAEILLQQPKLLLGVAMSVAIGTVWIRRIVNFEY